VRGTHVRLQCVHTPTHTATHTAHHTFAHTPWSSLSSVRVGVSASRRVEGEDSYVVPGAGRIENPGLLNTAPDMRAEGIIGVGLVASLLS
jgi:hypothetical protein